MREEDGAHQKLRRANVDVFHSLAFLGSCPKCFPLGACVNPSGLVHATGEVEGGVPGAVTIVVRVDLQYLRFGVLTVVSKNS